MRTWVFLQPSLVMIVKMIELLLMLTMQSLVATAAMQIVVVVSASVFPFA